MAPVNPLKRTFQEAGFQNPQSFLPEKMDGSTTMISQPQAENLQLENELPLAAPSTDLPMTVDPPTQSSIPDSSLAEVAISTAALTAVPQTAAATKRRKLTPAEQEVRRLEKEAKDRQRADEKAKLEESRRVKEIEKEEKRKEKEAQTKQKDEERKRKEEEKTKKEKSQLRLNSFFGHPPVVNVEPATTARYENHSPSGSRRSSISSIGDGGTKPRSRSGSRPPLKAQLSEYERVFPKFFVQSHTYMAPQNQFSRDGESLKYAQSRIDEGLSSTPRIAAGTCVPLFDPFALFHLSSHRRTGLHNQNRLSVKEIVQMIQGTAHRPIDLTETRITNPSQKPTELLKCVTVKYLKFAEDVRPPYIGTFTKISDQSTISKLCRNPFAKTLPATDYGYDSEAEWEDPGEGEDLDSEGEEEAGDDEDGDEMEGFLDDEEGSEMARAAHLKHRPLIGDLEPSCTGLCWESAPNQEGLSSAEAKLTVGLSSLRLEIISDSFHLPINPYSTIYWQSTSTPSSNPLQSSMEPPSRLPLTTTTNRTNALLPPNREDTSKPPHTTASSTPTLKSPKRIIPPELMASFEAAVRGSDLTKAGLIEALKKQFPKQTKDTIKDTLNLVAERVGSKEVDKRWVIREGWDSGASLVVR